MIELDSISKRYGDVQALEPMSLVVQPGSTVALLGPSGCGKSTVLRIIVGLTRPDSGTVRIGGTVLDAANIVRQRHRMGYMIQDGGLFPHLNVRDNITLLARHLGEGRAKLDSRIEELAALVHLSTAMLDRYPFQLSGGQRQRAALMRALFLDPDVLLLDEPMAALDPLIRSGLQVELREIFAELGKTVLVVTHDIGEAGFLADDVILLEHGRVVQRGTLRDLVERPATPFVTTFLNAQRSPLESIGGSGA